MTALAFTLLISQMQICLLCDSPGHTELATRKLGRIHSLGTNAGGEQRLKAYHK
jgi:hypothetical protein